MGVPPSTNNAGEDLVKVCPAVAEQSRQKKKEKNSKTATKI